MNTITINGKEYPCRVTMGAMLRFRRETGKDINEIGSDDMSALFTFFWCCVASACAADGVEFGMSLIDFADQVEPDKLTGFYTQMNNGDGTDPEKKTGQPTS